MVLCPFLTVSDTIQPLHLVGSEAPSKGPALPASPSSLSPLVQVFLLLLDFRGVPWTSLFQLFSSADDLSPVAFSDGQGHEKVLRRRRTQTPGRQALRTPSSLWTTKGLGMLGSETLIPLALRREASESRALRVGPAALGPSPDRTKCGDWGRTLSNREAEAVPGWWKLRSPLAQRLTSHLSCVTSKLSPWGCNVWNRAVCSSSQDWSSLQEL